MLDLKGRVALVTGGSSGIGRAIALALSARGARVTVLGRSEARLRSVRSEIEAAGGEVFVVRADLRQESEIVAAFDASQARWGRLDVLVNSAAVGIESSLRDGRTEDWREMLEVNVLAVAMCMREAAKRFNAGTGGHIINIGSTSGHRIAAGASFYAATKFALTALSEILRQELRSRNELTRISIVSPGRVHTGFLRSDSHSSETMHMSNGSELFPEDIAMTVVHILTAPSHVEVNDIIIRPRDQAR